jgi:cell division protein FtsQ
MNMETMSGIRATRPRQVKSRRPLQPKKNLRVMPVFAGTMLLTLTVLLLMNFSSVAGFVNRPVTKVRMENQWQQVSEQEVSRLLAAYLGAGFFNFEVVALKEDLETLPWVRQAEVTRLWPDSLSLNLQEEIAIARWGEDELLSQQGQAFSPANAAAMSSLPRLAGPEGSQIDVMRQYQQLNELLFPAGLRLSALTLSERGSWELTVNNEIEIAAGREKLVERINRFIRFYNQSPDYVKSQIASVDLRYDNGLAVVNQLQESTEVAAR